MTPDDKIILALAFEALRSSGAHELFLTNEEIRAAERRTDVTTEVTKDGITFRRTNTD